MKKVYLALSCLFLVGCQYAPKKFSGEHTGSPAEREQERRVGKLFKKDLVLFDTRDSDALFEEADEKTKEEDLLLGEVADPLWQKAISALSPAGLEYVDKKEGIIQTKWEDDTAVTRHRVIFIRDKNHTEGYRLMVHHERKINNEWQPEHLKNDPLAAKLKKVLSRS